MTSRMANLGAICLISTKELLVHSLVLGEPKPENFKKESFVASADWAIEGLNLVGKES